MFGKNRNRLESPLGVWANPVYKTSWASLPAKQAITVDSSSGFNAKLIDDWSNFDLPKRMPEEHICFISALCLSLINTRQHTSQYVTYYGSANQKFADASVCRNEQKGVLIAGVPYPLSPTPLPFSLPPNPLLTPSKIGYKRLASGLLSTNLEEGRGVQYSTHCVKSRLLGTSISHISPWSQPFPTKHYL